MPKRASGKDACRLLEKAAKYISKGIEKGAYTATVGGDRVPNRLLDNIYDHLRRHNCNR